MAVVQPAKTAFADIYHLNLLYHILACLKPLE